MIKICAGIVTYNPDIDRLSENISAIINQVEKVYICDNGSLNINDIDNLVNSLSKTPYVIYNIDNGGIAKALNQIFTKAEEEKFDWCLTLDQDSVSPAGMVEILKSTIGEGVGIACPAIRDINRQNFQERNTCREVSKCITSGALTRVMAWKNINGFDEQMFIDGVDDDFSIRIRKNGWKIVENGNAVLKHEIGHIEERRFLFAKVIVRNHSAFRKYYIARNIIYLDRKHHLPGYPVKTVLRIIKLLFVTLLYEKDKLRKIKAIFKGVLSGLKKR